MPGDIYRQKTISNPQASPDGNWILYQLRTVDSVKDKTNSDIWITSFDGKESWQLTYDPGTESAAKWSPDGKFISFVAKRAGDKYSQVYCLPTRGGEAQRLTNVKGAIEEYLWAPSGKQLILAIGDPDYADSASTNIRKPYVITRYQFKQDRQGYLDSLSTHLYLFDIASKKLDTLTKGIYSETQPAVSPDGKHLAFVSNRTAIPDKNDNTDIYIMELKPGATAKALTTWKGSDSRPLFSDNSQQIVYLQSSSDEAFTMYGQSVVAVVPASGGSPKLLTNTLDRAVRNPQWNSGVNSLLATIEDDRRVQLIELNVENSTTQVLTKGDHALYAVERVKNKSASLVLKSTSTSPAELFVWENNTFRQLTHVQDSFLAPLQLPKAEGFEFKSKDGASISGILYTPANYEAKKKLPLIIFIHGGPVGQDQFDFDITRMVYASAGYAVAAVNYRGSSGRGVAFTRAVYANWGKKEVLDIIGAADYLVAKGIADPNRMGLGGWSYGGITTNYTIATDPRFKAAVSGAGSSLQLSIYGTDQYINQYDTELGTPWKNKEKWIAQSYPFFEVEKIKTPTLFMASEKDFNVPVAGAEQMYQALKAVGIPTELIIYPNQYHGISVPSYQVDRLNRHIAWYNTYLK